MRTIRNLTLYSLLAAILVLELCAKVIVADREVHPGESQVGPPSVGLIQSTDGGRSWTGLSLSGEADFHALEYDGTTFDCGDKIGLLRANVAFALQRPEFADAARQAIGDLL